MTKPTVSDRGQENYYRIDPTGEGNEVLYMYPVEQIIKPGHPELTQFVSVVRWGSEDVLLMIKHSLGETVIKLNRDVLLDGVQAYLSR